MAATPSAGGRRSRELRKDAAENRERILEAGAALFAESGVDVPFDEIATRAGVGIATLYRRFPTRQDLIEAVFAKPFEAYLAAAEEALAMEDPWEGFRFFIGRICAMQAANCGIRDVLTMTLPTCQTLEAIRAETMEKLGLLAARAIDQGALRPDFELVDIDSVLLANGAIVQATCASAPVASKRFVGLILDAFSARGAQALPRAPREEVRTALEAAAPSRRRRAAGRSR